MKKHDINSFNEKLKNNNIHYRLINKYPKDNHSQTEFLCLIHKNIFIARPDNILSGFTSCKECNREYRLNKFINNLNERSIKYKITGVFIDTKTKTQFYCEEHDCYFDSIPKNILKGYKSCPICSNLYWTLEEYNQYIRTRNIICYEFITTNDKTKHECLNCGYIWEQKPGHILYGTGCPQCAKYGFNTKIPAILYYITINHNNNLYYKIGITNKNITERFKGDDIIYDVVFYKTFERGEDAKTLEQNILEQNVIYKYIGPKILRCGNTEIFIKDIFNGEYDI